MAFGFEQKSRASTRGEMHILKDVYQRNNMNSVPLKGLSRYFVGSRRKGWIVQLGVYGYIHLGKSKWYEEL